MPELVTPEAAIAQVRASETRPWLLAESADSPTAGATGDSPAMVRVLLEHGQGLRCHVTLVDAPAVEAATRAGLGAKVAVRVGCMLDQRFHEPVDVAGKVSYVGQDTVTLTGPGYTGMQIAIGRCAVLLLLAGLSVLVTERPAPTYDPATFRSVSLDPEITHIVVVQSANLFRAGYAKIFNQVILLDLPGASTPQFRHLLYTAPRPLYPLNTAVS